MALSGRDITIGDVARSGPSPAVSTTTATRRIAMSTTTTTSCPKATEEGLALADMTRSRPALSTGRAMNRTLGAEQSSVRVAFWGYTNDRGLDAALPLTRQFRSCQAALDGRAAIGRYFYATPEPVSDLLMLVLRDAGGPPCCDGGWDELAAVLPAADRGFDAIICADIDRIGRRAERRRARLDLLADHDVAILCADEPLPDLPQPTVGISGRLLRQVTTGLHEYVASWDALMRRGNRRASG